ncbi:Uncharacterized protein FVE85_9678 [Porphyridium purpureum]|uniref:Uncharacterized protein n=1 Tax=Porphyridium purpureum TaxID=35688 RepID=A0A5J4YJK7_PORPP|nr:Uncharacterized protein FVE85_9678 [Porphyridium purpureum]|eukprot:POR0621..scf246_12
MAFVNGMMFGGVAAGQLGRTLQVSRVAGVMTVAPRARAQVMMNSSLDKDYDKTKSAVGDAAENVKDKTHDIASDGSDAAKDAYENSKDKVTDTAENVGDYAKDAANKTKDAFKDAKENVKDTAKKVGSNMEDAKDEVTK